MEIPIIDASQVIQGRQQYKPLYESEKKKRIELEGQLKAIEIHYKEFQERMNKIHQISAM